MWFRPWRRQQDPNHPRITLLNFLKMLMSKMPTNNMEIKRKPSPLNLSERIPELDGIRGIAISMVLVYHYFLLPIQPHPGTVLYYVQVAGRLAWSGVDLFFVLSGFLIGGILLDVRDSTNYFQVFYMRRFLRIVPIYAVVLASAFVLTRLGGLGSTERFTFMYQDRLPWLPYLFFLQNFWMTIRTSLGAWVLGVSWSLAVEEQFYLTLPSIVRILSPERLSAVLVGGILAAPALRILFHSFWPTHIYSWVVIMPCRADALLLGVLGAIVLRNRQWRARLERNRTGLIGLLALFACGFIFLTLRSSSPYSLGMLSVGFTWLALFYLLMLVCALILRESWFGRLLRYDWLRWLGSIAYGTYLIHEFVRGAFFALIWSRPPVNLSLQEFGVSVLALATTLILCRLSWVLLEKPLVKLGHRAHYQSDVRRKVEVLVGTPVEENNA